MKTVLVGLGKVGKNIAAELAREKHDLVVVDINKDCVDDISTNYDALGITGNAVSLEVLKEAHVDDADLLIAVTDSDENNMLSCLFAQKLNKNIKTIARVRNPIYSSQSQYLKTMLGITSTINPEVVTAREIARLLKFSNVVQVETFPKGRVELISLPVKSEMPIVNKKIKEISSIIGDSALFVGVQRGEETIIPHGDTEIEENDTVSVILRGDDTRTFFSSIKLESHGAKNVMIVGASMISYHLATILERSKIKVTIIERDKGRCEELSRLLTDTNVILGDASDKMVLEEEGLENYDAFVSLTNMDEENVMLSLYAKNICKGLVITKVDHINYDSMLNTMGINPIIAPKKVIANEVVAYVRSLENANGNKISGLYRIMNDKAEVLCFDVHNEASFINKTLSELDTIDDVLICAIIREGKVIIPSGKDAIKLHDRVLVSTTHFGMNDIEDVFK